jgi:carbonic anhydrase
MTSIDITKSKISGKCDLKCAYNFKYNSTNLVATNKKTSIKIDCDKDNVAPVTYNTVKYNVSKMELYAPSIQLYNGKKADAELIITHTSDTGGKTLNVCIPFVSSNDSNSASLLMKNVIDGVRSGAPANGNKTSITISEFTLQDIIPRKPFYNYTATANNEYITFDTLYAIPINSTSLKNLKKIISVNSRIVPKAKLFYNEKGPNSSLANEGIYISCNPTGSSGETVEVTKASNPIINDLATTFNDPIFMTIIQLFVALLVFMALYYGFNFLYDLAFVKGAKKMDFGFNSKSSSGSQ